MTIGGYRTAIIAFISLTGGVAYAMSSTLLGTGHTHFAHCHGSGKIMLRHACGLLLRSALECT